MTRRSKPLTAWLLLTIAGSLLLADAGQVMVGRKPVQLYELFMAGMTLVAGAAIAASAESRWR